MLQVILGADDHTASDGAYVRANKARKWLYLASAVSAALAYKLYNEDAASALLKVISLPRWTLVQGVGFGLFYLTVQYALLLEQVRSVYDLEIAERFAAKLQTERQAAHAAVDSAATALAGIDRDLGSLEAKLYLERERRDSGHAFSETELRSLEGQLAAGRANRDLAAQDLGAASVRAGSIDARDPSNRSRFVLTEKLIDLIRLATPLLAALAALIGLALSLIA